MISKGNYFTFLGLRRGFCAWDPPMDDIFLAKTPVWTYSFNVSSVTRETTQLQEVTVLALDIFDYKEKYCWLKDCDVKPASHQKVSATKD